MRHYDQSFALGQGVVGDTRTRASQTNRGPVHGPQQAQSARRLVLQPMAGDAVTIQHRLDRPREREPASILRATGRHKLRIGLTSRSFR